MNRRRVPNPANGHWQSPGYNPNVSPTPARRRRPGKAVVIGGGAIATSLALTAVLLSAGGNNEGQPRANTTPDAPVPSSASQYPSTTEAPKATISTTPSTTEAAPTTTATTETTTAPVDPYQSLRHAIVNKFDSCGLNSFTNDGNHKVKGRMVTQLAANLLFENNGESIAAAKAAPQEVVVGSPEIVVFNIGPDVVTDGREDIFSRMPAADVHSREHPTISVPYPSQPGSLVAVGVMNTATTPNAQGGYNVSTNVELCGTVENTGPGEWRRPESDPLAGLPRDTTFDIHQPY